MDDDERDKAGAMGLCWSCSNNLIIVFQLHGTKWNSEMPRFAANLGFSPLQPMRPTVVATATGTGTLKPMPVGSATGGGVVAVGDVPAASFDWDSSGLVNPLHGECK